MLILPTNIKRIALLHTAQVIHVNQRAFSLVILRWSSFYCLLIHYSIIFILSPFGGWIVWPLHLSSFLCYGHQIDFFLVSLQNFSLL